MKKSINYKSAGIDYNVLDLLKVYAQGQSASTSPLLKRNKLREISSSRGESAYVFDMGKFYGAITIEGLGTKNIVAEKYDPENSIYWENLAKDTVAMIVNDLATVGATPVVISPHWASGDSHWFKNKKRWKGLVDGWRKACEETGSVYAGGETASLPGIVNASTIELSGSAFGIINPKERLILGEKIVPGDRIVLVESSGIHANGLSLARKLADEILPDGYKTKLPSGRELGQALLIPTHLYSPLVDKLFEKEIGLHYIVNITGHGWRKLMRAKKSFTYKINMNIPVPEEFDLIQKTARLSNSEMYATFNMGAGFAFILPKKDVGSVLRIAKDFGLKAYDAGVVEKGPRQVIIEPKNIIFSSGTLSIR